MRESPSLKIVAGIADWEHVNVLVCDPFVAALPEILAAKPNVRQVDAATALHEADIAVLLVGHRQFRQIEQNQFLNKVVIDATGLLSEPRNMEAE